MMKSTTIHYIPSVYVYDVVPSVMALSFARGDDDSLTPSQYKVTCGYVKRSKKTTVSVADQPIGFENDTYQIYYRYLIGSAWSQWQTYTGAITVKSDTTCSAYEFCISKLVSHDNVNDSTIIARKTIPVSKDGQSAVQVSLSPSAILHKKQSDDAYYVVDVSVKRGKKKNTSFGMYDFSLPLGVDEYTILQPSDSNGNKNQVQFKVSANNVPTGEITFKVSLDGIDYEQSIPIKTVADGIQGIQGLQGPSVRGPQIWQDVADGYKFFAGNSANGDKYKDTVYDSSDKNYYSCITTHTKSASSLAPSNDSTNWKVDEKIEIVATSLLLAKKAIIKNLIAEGIQMYDKDGNNIVFDAQDGSLTCKTGTFDSITVNKSKLKDVSVDGIIASPFVIDNSERSIFIDENGEVTETTSAFQHDNIIYNPQLHILPWDVSASGRLVTVCHYEGTSGEATFTAPTGMYFYEDGLKKSSIECSRQAILLKGYGTNAKFLGWIVVRRIDLSTEHSYGRELKCLCIGTLTYNGSVSLSYKTFEENANTLTATRIEEGRYRITIPSSWNVLKSNLLVMVSGRGHSYNAGTPIKATFYDVDGTYTNGSSEIIATSFIVETSDDSSRNDGAFDFMIYNKDDWNMI